MGRHSSDGAPMPLYQWLEGRVEYVRRAKHGRARGGEVLSRTGFKSPAQEEACSRPDPSGGFLQHSRERSREENSFSNAREQKLIVDSERDDWFGVKSWPLDLYLAAKKISKGE